MLDRMLHIEGTKTCLNIHRDHIPTAENKIKVSK